MNDQVTITAVIRLHQLGDRDDPRNRVWIHDGTKWRRGAFTLEANVEQLEITRDGTLGGQPDDFRRFISGQRTYGITIEPDSKWGREVFRYQASGPVSVTDRSRVRVLVVGSVFGVS